jgi:hypothetical protein
MDEMDEIEKSIKIDEYKNPTEKGEIENPTEKGEIEKSPGNKLVLELGDIIEIVAPRNPNIHEITGLITYIDNTKITIIDVASVKLYQLNLSENGNFTDETITEILLLSRSDDKGYAKQNKLEPRTWVDIYFGGEIPVIITGEITNLEEDMIELTTYPDLEVIYIDFEYKGIPEHIPIEKIIIRQKPASLHKMGSLNLVKQQIESGEIPEIPTDDIASMEFTDSGETIIIIPETAEADENIREALHDIYIDANAIVFGEELETITQLVEVPEREQRYGVETQVNDLMDEILSTIPNSQRSKSVLDNIHLLIERFKELRQHFSKFDDNSNVYDVQIQGPYYKPLAERLQKLDTKLQWFIPVVTNQKKIYPVDDIDYDVNPNLAHIRPIYEDLRKIERIQNDFFKNKSHTRTTNYTLMNSSIQEIMRPFAKPIESNNVLTNQEVCTNIDTIVSNFEDMYSTVAGKGGSLSERRRFVIQRYNLGLTTLKERIMKNGKKVFSKVPMTPNDPISVRSFLMMPAPIMNYSKIDLPQTSLYEKSALHHNKLLLFRLLRDNTEVVKHVIEDLTLEFDHEKYEKDTGMPFLSQFQEFILSGDVVADDDKYNKFLEVIIPKTRTIIRLARKYIKHKLSFVDVVQNLEPFLIYPENITYKQYMEIRYFIKEQMFDIKKNYAKKSAEFSGIRNTKYNITEKPNTMLQLLAEKKEFADAFIQSYTIMSNSVVPLTSQEIMLKIIQSDQGKLYTNLLSSLLLSLMTPNNLMDILAKPAIEEMSDIEKIKPTDCARRYLSKRYTSMKDLQKENNVDEIYFDKDFDDTPYDIMKKYKDEQKKMMPEDFVEYLAENLIQKHDCPPSVAKELAATMIAEKKPVRDGDYAILEIIPQLPSSIDEKTLTEEEKSEIENEANIRKKIQYYRRVKNNWVHDDSIDEIAFVDTNTLFCNISQNCYKNRNNNICENLDDTANRLRQQSRDKMRGEFDKRYVITVEELEKHLENNIALYSKNLVKSHILREIQMHKANNLAYQLGKMVVTNTDEIIVSPHMKLRDLILGQEDFVKKQYDIIKFVDKFTREPMITEMKEDAQWKYCVDTNMKLLPAFFYVLALAFVQGSDENNYIKTLNEISHSHGILSDDGDSIVDKHSGFIIRKIVYSAEEGFDESGFKISTHALMEKDMGTVLLEKTKKTDAALRVFENDTTLTIFNIANALCINIDVPVEQVDEFVLRYVTELTNKVIVNEATYAKRSAKQEKEKGKPLEPYALYSQSTLVLLIATVLFVRIQTAIPSFQTKKTFPGCVRSFSGYPLGGDEDTSGLLYIACVIGKMKSSISLWKSIEKYKATELVKRMKVILDSAVLKRDDIQTLFTDKRQYISLYPELSTPEEHSISKWRHFLPPIVDFSVIKRAINIGGDFQKDLLEVMRKGKRDQYDYFHVLQSKINVFSYAIVESINHIVKNKELLLKTASKVPFTENACCNDNQSMETPINYFIAENDNIQVYLHNVTKLALLMNDVNAISKAAIYYHPESTGIKYPAIPLGHLEENVYAAFIHYCNFDRNLPVPEHYQVVCNNKPANYNSSWTIQEKVEFLKKNGKRYNVDNLHELMRIVNRNNLIQVDIPKPFTIVNAFKDAVESLDLTESTVIEEPMRKHLMKVIRKYDPTVMANEESVELDNLKNYLYETNNKLYVRIMDFFHRYGNLSNANYTKIDKWLTGISDWKTGEIHTSSGFFLNAIETISKIYPNMVINNTTLQNTYAWSERWGFSEFDAAEIETFRNKYYEKIQKFKQDAVLTQLLKDVSQRLNDLHMFVQHIPVTTPIQKGGETFFSLFDKNALDLLFTYCLYSALYEYIVSSEDPHMLRADIEKFKQDRRTTIDERNRDANNIHAEFTTLPEEFADSEMDLQEMQIVTGTIEELKQRVCQFLLAMLDSEEKNKILINTPYSGIMKNVQRYKVKEKATITDYLRDLTIEERKIENSMKEKKIGKWNVGMQKGLIHYDESTNMRERDNLMGYLMQDANAGISDDYTELLFENYNIPQTAAREEMNVVEDLEKFEEQETEDFYDREAYGIENLGEDYADGEYYEEDRENENDNY